MPKLISEQSQKGILELLIVLQVDELPPFLEKAANALQKIRPLPGFRPGKASYETIKKSFGAMAILEEAIKHIVPSAYVQIIKENKFPTIGEPAIEVLKLVPDQPIEFTAKVATMPIVTLGDYKKIKEKQEKIEVKNDEIDKVIDELRDLRSEQVPVAKSATKNDWVNIDMTISRDGVVLDGGETKGHRIDLSRPYIIPGFVDELMGTQAGDIKTFSLPFPEDHYDKTLAGKKMDYKIIVNTVLENKRPETNDSFVKTFGNFSTLEELKTQIKENITAMKKEKENQRIERSLIEKLIKSSTFGDIPELLLVSELQKILGRMQNQVHQNGGVWIDYLSHIGKSEEELMKSWIPEAETRVKAALLTRSIAEAENIDVSDEEIENERNIILSYYKSAEDEEIKEEIKSSEYDPHLKHIIITRKVMNLLTDIATK